MRLVTTGAVQQVDDIGERAKGEHRSDGYHERGNRSRGDLKKRHYLGSLPGRGNYSR